MNIVAIRVDSSEQIGSGHLMRCLTLAVRLRQAGSDVHFISRDLVGNMHRLITKHGFPLHLLPRHEANPNLTGYAAWLTVTQEVDAQETEMVLHRLPPVLCLVVDSYALDATWERKIRPLCREIFIIDDLANRPHDCDILLDQNFYREMEYRYDGLVPPHCKLLLGPTHALLREEFYAARNHLKERDGNLRRILVFYGGSDFTNETEKALTVLRELALPDVAVDVIVGGGNARREEIRKICSETPMFHYHEQVENMAELMARADLALGAGGTTTWERCFLGLPSIVTAIAENQYAICYDCHEAGLIQYIGKAKAVTTEAIKTAILSLTDKDALRRFAERCRLEAAETPCPGDAAHRIITGVHSVNR